MESFLAIYSELLLQSHSSILDSRIFQTWSRLYFSLSHSLIPAFQFRLYSSYSKSTFSLRIYSISSKFAFLDIFQVSSSHTKASSSSLKSETQFTISAQQVLRAVCTSCKSTFGSSSCLNLSLNSSNSFVSALPA